MASHQKGLTIVLTGNGKGKTTSALGMVLRAVGRKKKVLIVQFMKNAEYGEHKALKMLPGVTVAVKGKGFCRTCGDTLPLEKHRDAAREALVYAEKAIKSKRFDMIVLDEINCAVLCKLITSSDVVALVKKKPRTLHLILTGRGASRNLIACADLVSEIKEVKHPYQKGVRAQEGIEF